MSLDRVVDLLAARLASALPAGPRVDDVAPASADDLPCVVVSVSAVEQALAGVGRLPRGTRRGALLLTAAVDLADPVLDLGGGESLTLLSADRRTLTLPHGPLVAADGTEGPPGPGDVGAADGDGPFTVVTTEPAGRQVRADAAAGTLAFGTALPGSGTLTVTYHVGQWDVVTTRAQGELAVDVTAAAPEAVRATSRSVAGVLAGGLSGGDATLRLVPRGWAPVLPAAVGTTAVRTQRLTFGLDAEVADPVLTTSGGVITRVAVAGALAATPPEPIEPFDVTRGAPT